MKRTLILLCTLFGGLGMAQAEEPLTLNVRTLTTDMALKIAANAYEVCTKKGYKVAVSVVGRDGHLLAFMRNPLAGPHTIAVSQGKAYAAASFGVPTSSMGDMRDLAFAPGVMLAIGGMPIDVAGHFYGGVGVSGADPKEDEVCAGAGIEAVTEQLEFAG